MLDFDNFFNWYNFFNYPFYNYKKSTDNYKKESENKKKDEGVKIKVKSLDEDTLRSNTVKEDKNKLVNTKDINNDISDTIHEYIRDGYKIDPRESIITDSDKDCTFKAVLKKDVDGIECKTTITLNENIEGDVRHSTYRKVDLVGNQVFKGETKKFTSLVHKESSNKEVKEENKKNPDGLRFERLEDYIKIDDKGKTKKVRRWKVSSPSIIKHHTKVNDTNKNSTKENSNVNNKKEVKMSEIDEMVSKIRESLNTSIKESFVEKDTPDEVEDSLVTMIRRIFGL